MKKYLLLMTFMVSLTSCGGEKMFRNPGPGFSFTNKISVFDESSLEYQMEMALLITDEDKCYEKVEELLKKGADPNKKTGQFKWIDTNPLWGCCGNKKFLKLFIDYGADVKNRPYIARLLIDRILATKNPRKEWVEWHKEHPQVAVSYESEVYEVIKYLLDSGADPNMKCAGNKVLLIPTDWNYRRYNEKHGESAIDSCIEMNLLSIYALLIEHGAKLDEKSIELAKETTERTGSNEMENLVMKHWELQNKNRKK